ncbi:DNA-directed DNA polymerase, family A, palm domain containing protein [uncultured Caudovirales phage]|uniref:DNA-directed DNA polymerase, family A, palm domain containing protein n=1 Tax=uncultured Caudovirales phage TaxID=2100421 RepID=A0A6J5KU11_9CAUD|nr:DNA-directed DNA polymerase, family A, palm domain containing protein [uncultured Caudovirales phage]
MTQETILWLDTETYSECDLKAHGTHRYAEHPSTEITVAQWAVGDGEPFVADCTNGQDIRNLTVMRWLRDPRVIVYAHNSAFDRTLLRHCWGIDVPVERWRDTMVKALAHGLPGALGKLGPILGLPEDQQKDKRGKQLIQLFCKPRPKGNKLRRATRESHPAEWSEFLEYSRQDIIAMREVDRRLPGWNYRGGELALWHLDQRINDRGFAVDLDLARGAIAATDIEKVRLKREVVEATNGLVSSASKVDQMLVFILAEYGVSLPDMRADTLRRRIEDPELPDPVKLLLNIRLEATKTSTAKYQALAKATSADGRLRNTLQFAGALRTARWAGRIFQPQNMPRPDVGLIAEHFGVSMKGLTDELTQEYEDQGVAALKGGFADVVFNNVMGMSANLVRGAIVAPPGKKLCIADLANIEGRGLAYLAGESWKIQAFRDYDSGTGADLYNLAYARSFNVKVEDIPKGGRQIGKVQELGLGYQGGVSAFLTFAAVYKMDLDAMADAVWASAPAEALENATGMLAWVKKKKRSTFGLSDRTYIACEVLKASWRAAHPATEAFWGDIEQAAKSAILHPGEQFRVRQIVARRDGAWLRIRLPSGRYLCYLNPELGTDGQITYMGINQYTRQWSRIKTYGGKLVENIVQAWARDVLADNMTDIDRAGYPIVLTVHDELLTETTDSDAYDWQTLAHLMARQPSWAPGVPLSAAGFETYRYKKD